MKIQHLIPILFLAAFCTVSAQTNNAPAESKSIKVNSLTVSTNSAKPGIFGEIEIPPATQEEKQFLNAVFNAFGKRDGSAAFELMCWNNVPNAEQRKKDWNWTNGYPQFDYNHDICDIKYVTLESFDWQPTDKDVWTYNIPVTKCIYWENCPTNFGSHDLGDFSGSFLGIGEKNGKLMIAMRIIKPSLLTTNQVTALAMQLASDKWNKDYPSRGQPKFVTGTQRFTAGHWIWIAAQGFGHGDIQATVELAADGSTNSVSLTLLDNQLEINAAGRR